MGLLYRQRNNPNSLAQRSPLAQMSPRGDGGYVGANVQYPEWQRGTLGQALDEDPAMHERTQRVGPPGMKFSMTVAVPDPAEGRSPGLNRDYGTRGMGEPVYDRMSRVDSNKADDPYA